MELDLQEIGQWVAVIGGLLALWNTQRARERRRVVAEEEVKHRLTDLERRFAERHQSTERSEQEARAFRQDVYRWRDESKQAAAEQSERLVRLETLLRNGRG